MAVLRALAENHDRWRYGYELCSQLGVHAGSMYPILIRLTDRGLLETSWETERVSGRPARHLYRLTETGLAFATTQSALHPVPATAPPPGNVASGPRRTQLGPA